MDVGCTARGEHAGWLHQLTAAVEPGGRLRGHGGQAMIATLRHRLIRVPARLICRAHRLELRLPPNTTCSTRSSPASAPCPPRPDPGPTGPQTSGTRPPEATLGPASCPRTRIQTQKDQQKRNKDQRTATRGIGSERKTIFSWLSASVGSSPDSIVRSTSDAWRRRPSSQGSASLEASLPYLGRGDQSQRKGGDRLRCPAGASAMW